jgi:hypothetical protein
MAYEVVVPGRTAALENPEILAGQCFLSKRLGRKEAATLCPSAALVIKIGTELFTVVIRNEMLLRRPLLEMSVDQRPWQHCASGGGFRFPFRLLSDVSYGSFDKCRVDACGGGEPDDVVGVVKRVVDGLSIPIGVLPGKLFVAEQPRDPVFLLRPRKQRRSGRKFSNGSQKVGTCPHDQKTAGEWRNRPRTVIISTNGH